MVCPTSVIIVSFGSSVGLLVGFSVSTGFSVAAVSSTFATAGSDFDTVGSLSFPCDPITPITTKTIMSQNHHFLKKGFFVFNCLLPLR
ncbi:MAG TPA: hypothetical protein DEA91_18090 [Paenibacillus sp.]|nr:hypothetical protein [Paenibacillus sp.]